MLSGVERHRESRGEGDCLTLSERSKKSSGEKKKKSNNHNGGTNTNLYWEVLLELSENKKSGSQCEKKKYLLDIKSNKGFLLCKD